MSTPGHPQLQDRPDPDPKPSKVLFIPVNYITGIARLLFVEPIAKMYKKIVRKANIDNKKYSLVTEERRGLLRFYGRGEGLDTPPGYDKDFFINYISDIFNGINSNVFLPKIPPSEFLGSEINAEDIPDFLREAVIRLVKSYKKNINIIHFIFIPKVFDHLIESFLGLMPESWATTK